MARQKKDEPDIDMSAGEDTTDTPTKKRRVLGLNEDDISSWYVGQGTQTYPDVERAYRAFMRHSYSMPLWVGV